jgi:hypothetical protein
MNPSHQDARTALNAAEDAAKAAAVQRDKALQEREALASDKATLGRHPDAADARLAAAGSSHQRGSASKCDIMLRLGISTCEAEQICASVLTMHVNRRCLSSCRRALASQDSGHLRSTWSRANSVDSQVSTLLNLCRLRYDRVLCVQPLLALMLVRQVHARPTHKCW